MSNCIVCKHVSMQTFCLSCCRKIENFSPPQIIQKSMHSETHFTGYICQLDWILKLNRNSNCLRSMNIAKDIDIGFALFPSGKFQIDIFFLLLHKSKIQYMPVVSETTKDYSFGQWLIGIWSLCFLACHPLDTSMGFWFKWNASQCSFHSNKNGCRDEIASAWFFGKNPHRPFSMSMC